jgi:hypothetical protein
MVQAPFFRSKIAPAIGVWSEETVYMMLPATSTSSADIPQMPLVVRTWAGKPKY